MSTVQQIIDWVDRYFINSESDANKILDLDQLHKSTYVKIARLKNDYEIYDMGVTIEDQLTYTLPSNCRADDIIAVKVTVSDTTIDSDTEWDDYIYAGLNDDVENGKWWGKASSGTIAIVNDGEPIDTADLPIRIFYYVTPSSITAVTDTPTLNSDYHDCLKYGLCQMLASEGNNPDTELANYWQDKYDERIKDIEASLSDRDNSAPSQTQPTEYW